MLEPQERYRLWWARWWEEDFSWEGLEKKIARLQYVDLSPSGKRVIHVGSKSQIASAARPARLSDLFNLEANDLVTCPLTGRMYTPLHAPLEWQDGTKVELTPYQIKRAGDLLHSLLTRSHIVAHDKTIEQILLSEDSIPALLHGIVLRKNVKYPNIGNKESLIDLDHCFIESDISALVDISSFLFAKNCLFSSEQSIDRVEKRFSAQFVSSEFHFPVHIIDSTVRGDLEFRSCFFGSIVRIMRSLIDGSISLGGSHFSLASRYNDSGPIHRDDADDPCGFGDQEYLLVDSHQVLIRESTFKSCQFNQTQFESGFRMLSCTVFGGCSFGEEFDEEPQEAARFFDSLSIDRSTFGARLSLEGCEFGKSVSIIENSFQGVVLANRTSFVGASSDFFEIDIIISRNVFDKLFVFDIYNVYDLIWFSGSDFRAGAALERQASNLFDSVVGLVSGIKLIETRIAAAQKLGACAMNARQLLSQRTDQHMTVWLHRLQWRMQRISSKLSVEWFVSLVYDRVFGFGIDFRPIAGVFFLSPLVFAAIYGVFAYPYSGAKGVADFSWLVQNSFAHSLDVMFLGRSDQATEWQLNGNSFLDLVPANPSEPKDFRWIAIRAIEFLQLVVSSVGVFCGALAARRRFQVS